VKTSEGVGSAQSSKPHVAAITRLRFFPSNEVILAASMDMSISVISAIDHSVPRKLNGHSRPVTDLAIIERGRNVASSGKDGTVRLWDVGAGKQIGLMGVERYSPILRIASGSSYQISNGTTTNAEQVTEEETGGEVGTSGKMLWCALQSGRFTVLDLGTKTLIFTSSEGRVPISSIACSADKQLLATGSQNGVVAIYDTRTLGGAKQQPLHCCKRNGASIEDMTFGPSQNGEEAEILIATSDGLPYRLMLGSEGPRVGEELIGYDCDPVRAICCVGDSVWTAGDDGIVRRY